AQFAIAEPVQKKDLLESIKKILKCGRVHMGKNQARYSVQDVEDLKKAIIPYFKQHYLSDTKQKDFELWADGVEVIYKNKRKILSSWEKADFEKLIDIQKSIKKYKEKPRQTKWAPVAEELLKTLLKEKK
ncbi:LAGLIDADG family homing endonuclease, partial [Patescibacteria group bacterium]|nr:LAGLIDADG family homing endonuclease [Patescibacteria group bacterium]